MILIHFWHRCINCLKTKTYGMGGKDNHSILQSLLRETFEVVDDYTKKSNQQGSGNKQNVTCFFWLLVWLSLWPWRWRQYVPPKHRWTSASLCYIPEDNILHSDSCENLKSNINWDVIVKVKNVRLPLRN